MKRTTELIAEPLIVLPTMTPEQAAEAERIWERLRNGGRGLRGRLLGWVLRRSLGKQARNLRKSRGWTQRETAERAGLTVTTISRLERGCFSTTLRTLIRVASAFDVALLCWFLPWSELVRYWVTGRLSGRGHVPSFDEEGAAMEQK